MVQTIFDSAVPGKQPEESAWQQLYPSLYAQARRLAYTLSVPGWRGQEEDVAWDIVQETLRRVLEYAHKAEQNEVVPIQALERLVTVVAQNYSRDLRRREWRLMRHSTDTGGIDTEDFVDVRASFMELATENVYRGQLFQLVAREVARFPAKQRQALLTDLANRMVFESQPTALQAAFLAEGIRLEEYRHPLPQNARERGQYASLLAHAYKRLAASEQVRAYVA